MHLEKYRFKKVGYIFLFGLIFFIFGILLNYFVTGHAILSLFYNPEIIQAQPEINRFEVFFEDFLLGFKYFNNFEKGILPILFFLLLVSLFYLKIEKKKFIIFNLVLIFEPIFLFALADKIYHQMRYLGQSFFLNYILIGYFINLILIKNSKFGIILCILICLNYLYFSKEKKSQFY